LGFESPTIKAQNSNYRYSPNNKTVASKTYSSPALAAWRASLTAHPLHIGAPSAAVPCSHGAQALGLCRRQSHGFATIIRFVMIGANLSKYL
jgi:hypothetical protein